MMDKIRLQVEPALRALMPGFFENRRRDLERLRQALHEGDLDAIRDVGQNIRCFSRVYGLEGLTALGEAIRCAAEESSTQRIVLLHGQLADYLSRVELQD